MDHIIANEEADFALSMMRAISINDSFVFSPISIMLSLCLLHAGAKGNTKNEIRQAILPSFSDERFENYFSDILKRTTNSDKVKFLMANKLYARNDLQLNADYTATLRKSYNTSVETLDFSNAEESAAKVNQFFNETTYGKIDHLVDESSFSDALAFLLNGVFFAGDWQDKFLSTSSREITFYKNYTPYKNVYTLVDMETMRHYVEDDDCQILKLPYEDDRFSFVVILPRADIGWETFKKQLTGKRLQELLGSTSPRLVNVVLPKMRFTTEINLKDLLPKVGIKDVFSNAADLSGISSGVKISEAKTKSAIVVDEAGVQRHYANITLPLRPRNGSVNFFADNSFIFALVCSGPSWMREKEHLLLLGQFMGLNDGWLGPYNPVPVVKNLFKDIYKAIF